MQKIENPLALATFGDRKSASGKLLGQTVRFTNESAKEIKARLLASGVAKRDVKKAVDSVLRGERSTRNIIGQAVVSKLVEDGYTFDTANTSKNAATVKMVKVAKPVISTADILELDPETRKELLEAVAKLEKENENTVNIESEKSDEPEKSEDKAE